MEKNLKRTIFSSVLLICLCIINIIGGTYAWFTDSVDSSTSRISAGNLDVELYYKNVVTSKDKAGDDQWANVENMGEEALFFVDSEGNDLLWEPGMVAVCYFKVKNKGNVALNYSFTSLVTDDNDANLNVKLSDVVKGCIITGSAEITSRQDAIELGNESDTGFINISTIANTHTLSKNDTETFTVILYWEPTDNDNAYNMKNQYQGKKIWMDVDFKLVAIQYSEENDTFDSTYDSNVQFPG